MKTQTKSRRNKSAAYLYMNTVLWKTAKAFNNEIKNFIKFSTAIIHIPI
jgi:hypothetical protein